MSSNVDECKPLLPGGGAVEMAVSRAIAEEALKIEGVEQWPFRAIGAALEVIPRTLAQNCGANVIRTLTKLRAKHAEATAESTGGKACTFGIDGNKVGTGWAGPTQQPCRAPPRHPSYPTLQTLIY